MKTQLHQVKFLKIWKKKKSSIFIYFPDITPTGSLRRRRSRVLSEEDDGSLMDFLRSSGHDNGSRERKPSSYGSLGMLHLIKINYNIFNENYV